MKLHLKILNEKNKLRKPIAPPLYLRHWVQVIDSYKVCAVISQYVVI